MSEYRRIICAGIGLAALAGLSACSPPDAGNNSALPADNGMAMNNSATALPTNALDLASAAVFADKPVFDNKYGHYSFSNSKLVTAPFGPVLVSEGTGIDAAHVTPGIVGAFYLKRTGDDFTVTGRYPDMVALGGFGRVGSWSVRNDMSENPMIVTQGGYTAQGYTCGHTILTELTPDGPKQRLNFVDTVDNKGALGDDGSATMGSITAATPQGFDVKFTGSRDFTAHYTRDGGKYVLQGGDKNSLSCD